MSIGHFRFRHWKRARGRAGPAWIMDGQAHGPRVGGDLLLKRPEEKERSMDGWIVNELYYLLDE
jgi:hypothetical protein